MGNTTTTVKRSQHAPTAMRQMKWEKPVIAQRGQRVKQKAGSTTVGRRTQASPAIAKHNAKVKDTRKKKVELKDVQEQMLARALAKMPPQNYTHSNRSAPGSNNIMARSELYRRLSVHGLN